MTCRTESSQVWVHDYNAENRISAVYKMDGADCASQGSATHTWTYTGVHPELAEGAAMAFESPR